MKIFLDDERFPPDDGSEWTIVRSIDAAIHFMMTYKFTFISFDHDLGLGQLTGYDLVNWMIERDLDMEGQFIPANFGFYVHSQNPVGAKNIQEKLQSYLDQRH